VETLWSPWRHEYIKASGTDNPDRACLFCFAQKDPAEDESNLVVARGDDNFVILNRYPYTGGHLMIAPYEHVSGLADASKATTDEMMDLAKRCENALREVYHPEGFNVGMNLGKVAGAGVADHIHLHIVPRWGGDTNFMTAVAETRVLPEDLAMTYQKLRGKI
jgi:ATP adenylyltransferase